MHCNTRCLRRYPGFALRVRTGTHDASRVLADIVQPQKHVCTATCVDGIVVPVLDSISQKMLLRAEMRCRPLRVFSQILYHIELLTRVTLKLVSCLKRCDNRLPREIIPLFDALEKR